MDVIPALDILDGRCVRLYQGNYERSEVFGEDPVAIAQRWYDEGTKYLHVVDFNGAKEGMPKNLKVIEAIARSLPIHVQVGGGLRDRDSVRAILYAGGHTPTAHSAQKLCHVLHPHQSSVWVYHL